MAVEKIAKALGMTVMIAERKVASETRPGRTPFDAALRKATVFIFVTPLDESTRDMIGTPELMAMDDTALLVNVGQSSFSSLQSKTRNIVSHLVSDSGRRERRRH